MHITRSTRQPKIRLGVAAVITGLTLAAATSIHPGSGLDAKPGIYGNSSGGGGSRSVAG